MKNIINIRGLIIAVAIMGLAGFAFAQGGGMMGGGGGYGYGMMGNGNGYNQGMMGNGYGSGYGMMDPGQGYGNHMGNNGYDNRSREYAAPQQQSRDRFGQATRGLRNDIQDKQAALQAELDKANPDQGKLHFLQSELSKLRAEYDRKALDFRLENRNVLPNGQNGQR